MSADPFVELRGDVDSRDVAVMDAVVQATPGASRTSLLREIIAKWAEQERHRSRLVQNTCTGNGTGLETHRKSTGNAPGGRR